MRKKHIILLLAILVPFFTILFFKGCKTSSVVAELLKGLLPNTEVLLRIDTVLLRDTLLELRVDTIYQPDTIYLDKILKPEPDTVFALDQDTIFKYFGKSEDATVAISYEVSTFGLMRDIQLNYKLKTPKIIEKTITKTITEIKTITRDLYKGGLYVGVGLNYVPNLKYRSFMSVDVGYVSKGGWYIVYRYPLTTNIHSISVQKRLF